MNEQDKKEMTEILTSVVKPIQDDITAIKTDVAARAEEAKTIKVDLDKLREDEDKKWASMPRKLMDGTVFPFGDGRAIAGKGAPAYVRPDNLGDRPYSFGKLTMAILEKNEAIAPLEVHISEQLKNVMLFGGLSKMGGRSYWVPLTDDPAYYGHVESQAADSVKALIGDAMPLSPDPYEMKAYSRKFGMSYNGIDSLKTMDPLDETIGGAFMPFPERGMLIELIRKATVMGPAGCQQIGLPPGGLDYPKERGVNTFQRLPVNQTINDGTPAQTTGSVRLIPKPIQGLVKLPNALIKFSNPAVEGVVRRALVADLAVACDYDYLNGTGGTSTPMGLLRWQRSANDTPTADYVTLHNAATTDTNGDTFGVTDPDMMVSLIEEAPDPEGPTAWLMYPRMFWKLAGRRADAVYTGDGAGLFMFPVTRGALSGAVQKELLNTQVITSTQMPKNRNKGSGTALTVIVLGNFRRAVIGRVGAVEIASSTDAGFAADQTWIRVIAYDDFSVLTPESFCVSDQLLIA